MAEDIFPENLRTQISRFGIRLDQPTDLYAYDKTSAGAYCRLTYHVVGKLLEGPLVFSEGKFGGRELRYQEVRAEPKFLSMAVARHRDTHCPGPLLESEDAGELLQLDFRLHVPAIHGDIEQW